MVSLTTKQKEKITIWKIQFPTDGTVEYSHHLTPMWTNGYPMTYCYHIEAHLNGDNNNDIGHHFVGQRFYL